MESVSVCTSYPVLLNKTPCCNRSVIRNNEIIVTISNVRMRTFRVFTDRITYNVMKLRQIIVESVEKEL